MTTAQRLALDQRYIKLTLGDPDDPAELAQVAKLAVEDVQLVIATFEKHTSELDLRVQRDIAARGAALRRFLAAHRDAVFWAPSPKYGPGSYVIVHSSTKTRGGWQASFFDADGPIGDWPRKDYAKLLAELQRDAGVDLDRAEIAEALRPPRAPASLGALARAFS